MFVLASSALASTLFTNWSATPYSSRADCLKDGTLRVRESMALATATTVDCIACWLNEAPGSVRNWAEKSVIKKEPGIACDWRKKQIASFLENPVVGWIASGLGSRSCCAVDWCWKFQWEDWVESAAPPPGIFCSGKAARDDRCGDWRCEEGCAGFDGPATLRTIDWLSSRNINDSSSRYPGHSRLVRVHWVQAGRV